MIAVQVFVGLVLFAAFLGLVVIVGQLLGSVGRFGHAIRSERIGRGLREATVEQWAAAIAVALAGCAVAGGIGWALA